MLKEKIRNIYILLKKIFTKRKLNKILKNCSENQDVFLIGSPLHGNIGDHAISIAERELLKNLDKNVVEIPGVYFNYFTNLVKKHVKENDIVIITGGGFMGTLWINEETMVRNIISAFPNNKIIIMPQTIYFEDSKYGKEQLLKSKEIYNSHNRLYFLLRDMKSYEFCKNNFENGSNIYYLPDVVTYLNYSTQNTERENVALLCLRKDKEKVIDENLVSKIENILSSYNLEIKNTTTVIKEAISLEDRKKVFENKLSEFRNSKIVITDRLHAMIFSAITGTPCIAFDNLSGKVSGVYKWLEYLDYIVLIDKSEKDISKYINLLLTNNIPNVYVNNELREKLEQICTKLVN